MTRDVRAQRGYLGHVRALFLLLLTLSVLPSCRTLEASAAKDPMKCERDPSCKNKRSGTFDCSSQCADDPECISRCQQVEIPTGTSGR